MRHAERGDDTTIHEKHNFVFNYSQDICSETYIKILNQMS
jgi:hypothetical protein